MNEIGLVNVIFGKGGQSLELREATIRESYLKEGSLSRASAHKAASLIL